MSKSRRKSWRENLADSKGHTANAKIDASGPKDIASLPRASGTSWPITSEI